MTEKLESSEWTQEEAIKFCRGLEVITPHYGCHVALTGGLLYKEGERKDCDILLYRIRQVKKVDIEGLFETLATFGVCKVSGFGWCHKAIWKGKKIDFFFPEEQGGDYPDPEDEQEMLP